MRGARWLLPALVIVASCGGSGANNTSGSPVDSGSGGGDDVTADTGGGDAPSDAAAADVPVEAEAGALHRVMAVTADPRLVPAPTGTDFLDAFLLVQGAGARGDFMSSTWSKLEPQPGTFDLTSLASDLDFAGNKRGFDLLLGIQVLNTTAKETPTDLKTVAFDDPQMKSRFHALIDALAPRTNAHLLYLSVGNEVDVYLAAHPSEWSTYKNFYDDAVAYAHAKLPGIRVGITATFGGASGAAKSQVAQLASSSDVFILTYYPLGAQFVPMDPSVATSDIAQMVVLAGGKPLVMQEVGYPTDSQTLGSSEQKQAAFIENVFVAWKAHAEAIPFLNFFALHDFTPQMCDQFAQYYGAANDNAFKAYLCTLGLRKDDGTAKLGWPALIGAAQATGIP